MNPIRYVLALGSVVSRLKKEIAVLRKMQDECSLLGNISLAAQSKLLADTIEVLITQYEERN